MIDEKLIATLPLLRGLDPAALRVLAARAVLRRFGPGEVLWEAGEEPRGLHLVVEGEVRVVRIVAGRQHVIHSEGEGGTLGEIPLFGGGRYPATAVATRRTTCLVLDRDAIRAAIREDPGLAFVLLARLGARVRELIGRLDALTSRSVPARLAGYLLARAQAVGGGAFTLGQSQQAVAEELGTVREVVVRALRELRERGLVEPVGRGRYRVLDAAGLREAADGG